jgi:glutamate dehydrogenase (NAD(P)+)
MPILSETYIDRSAGFQGFVVVDTTVAGRAMGGIRMTADVTRDDVAELARLMSLKLALPNLRIGGAKAGIQCALPYGKDRDRALWKFGERIAPLLESGIYLGSDQGITYRDRAVIFEAAGYDDSAIFSSSQGSLPCSWRQLWEELADITGHGVTEAASLAARRLGLWHDDITIAVQGFGIVGRGVAQGLAALGGRIVAVADKFGTVAAARGLPVEALLAATDPAGTIDRAALPGDIRTSAAPDAWLDVDADILVLAAGGHALHADNVDRTRARLIVEGANAPCSPTALKILADRGVIVVPGIVANSGSATVTALVLTGALSDGPPAPNVKALTESLFDRVGRQIRGVVLDVMAAAQERGLSLPQAAEQLAAERMAPDAEDRTPTPPPAQEETIEMPNDTVPDLAHATVGKPSDRLTDPLPAAMDPQEFVDQLTAEVLNSAAANIGPFYERLIAQQIPLEGVREWVKQWYIDSRMFPSVIGQIAANAGYFYDARQVMGANFAEELGEFNPLREHPVTVRQLARALGVSDEELEFTEPYPETLLYVEYRQHLVRDSHWLEGLAAGSFAIELTIPNRFRQIAKALSAQFDLDDEALEVFRIHAGDERLELDYGGDDKHAGEAQDLVRKYAVTAEMQHRVRLAMWRSIEARKVYQWGLFREICLKKDPLWSKIVAGSDLPSA